MPTIWPDGDFQALIRENEQVKAQLSPEEIDACFDPRHHLKNLDQIYQRLDI